MVKGILRKALKQADILEWRLGDFGGVDYRPDSSRIEDNRSPEMVNICLDGYGGIAKRPGFRYLLSQPVAGGAIGFIKYLDSEKKIIFAAGKNLYSWQENSTRPPLFLGELTAPPREAFQMQDGLWILDGEDYWLYRNSVLQKVKDIAYRPLLYENIVEQVTSAHKIVENINLLSPYYRVKFSPAQNQQQFILPQVWGATTCYEVKKHGLLLDKSQYTFNSSTMVLRFNTALDAGFNTVEVTLKISQGREVDFYGRISGCTICGIYGGDNDTRVFLSGNVLYANHDWYSGLYDPSYFPLDQETIIGWGDDPISGYSLLYDTMIIYKRNSIWCRQLQWLEGLPIYGIKPVNDYLGMVGSKSLQLIDNAPTMLCQGGVFSLFGGKTRDERNLRHISLPVDKRLFREKEPEKALSFDYLGYYGLAINGKVYLYDYSLGEWLFWDGIPAAAFAVIEGKLYFGSRENGMLCRFSLVGEEGYLVDRFADRGLSASVVDESRGIEAFWQSKVLYLGGEDIYKSLHKLSLTLGGDGADNACFISYFSDRFTSRQVKPCFAKGNDFCFWDFTAWDFSPKALNKVFIRSLKSKRVAYISLCLENKNKGENMEVGRLSLFYHLDKPLLV